MKNYRLEGDERRKAARSRWMELAWGAIRSLNNRQAMVSVAAETTMVDDGVGRVLKVLQDGDGNGRDTLIIFTADQSAAYGQHGLWGNTSWASPPPAYDEHMRVPLILSQAGAIPAGVRSDLVINQFDLMPTILDHAGLGDRAIENTPGASFAAALRGQGIEWGDAAYFEYIQTRAIRTARWKYVKRFLATPNELYDLATDPGETHNLVGEPAYAETVAAMDHKLTEFFDRFADPRYDVWRGGTAKAVLKYGADDGIFKDHFPNWRPPFVEKTAPFLEKERMQ